MNKLIKYLILISSIAVLTMTSVPIEAQPKIKNLRWAFIERFTLFLSWPEIKKGDEIAVCVVGKNPFSHVDNDFKSKNKTGNVIVAKLYESVPRLKVLRKCQMIYFSQNVSLAQLSFIFTQLDTLPIMTIGDHGAFVKLGGMLQFKQRGKKLRFSLNKELLGKVDLKVHPALIRMSL